MNLSQKYELTNHQIKWKSVTKEDLISNAFSPFATVTSMPSIKKQKNLTKRKKILCYKKSIVFMKWPRIILEILSLVTSMMSMETRFK